MVDRKSDSATVAHPHEDAETLGRGSQLRGAEAGCLVWCQLTGLPCHAGRYRFSIRTPPNTIRIATWSSHHAPLSPQVVKLETRANRARCDRSSRAARGRLVSNKTFAALPAQGSEFGVNSWWVYSVVVTTDLRKRTGNEN